MPPTLTLQDLARLCGVSKMTVSRALRSEPGVSAEVAEKIRKIAEKQGYQADPMVSATMKRLRQKSAATYRETLAFVWTHSTKASPTGIERWRDAARNRAEQLGYKLDEFFLRAKDVSSTRMRAIFQARGIRGILFAPDTERLFPHVPFDVTDFAAVLLGSSLYNRGLSRVQFDHFQLVHLALRQVRKAGYTRPGLLLTPSFDTRTQGRVRASYLAHAPGSVAERDRLLFPDLTTNRTAFAAWLKKAKPDVLLSLEDPRPALRAMGFKVPEDYPWVSLAKRANQTEVAGMTQSSEALGQTAVDLLVAQLQRREFGQLEFPQRVGIDALWSPGASLPKCER